MNLENVNTVEELQRQLEAANARNSQLEQFVQSQFNGDPTVLNHVAQNFAQGGFQIPSNGVSNARSVGLSRSKSTVTYPTQVKSAITERFQAHKRERRAFSQQSSSALPMSRSVSNRSESHMPFSQTGNRIAPLSSSMDRFSSPQNQSANLPLEAASNQLQSVQENQPLLNIGMDPEDFLKQWPETPQAPQHYDTSFTSMAYNMVPDNSYANLSSTIPSSYPMSSACPSTLVPVIDGHRFIVDKWWEVANQPLLRPDLSDYLVVQRAPFFGSLPFFGSFFGNPVTIKIVELLDRGADIN
jgi:hypothetical protein